MKPAAHEPTISVAPHMTWEQRVSHSSAQHAPELPHALYSANTSATTIRYSLYNAPWLPWQLSDCGRQKRYPANPKPSRSTYVKRVFIRWHSHLRRTREKTHITQLTLSGDFNLVFTRFQQPITPAPLTFHGHLASLRSSRRPIMVSKVTKNGTQDTLGTQKWYKLWPKMVNFGYGWPIMVSKVTKNGTQLVQKTHKLWSKQCKKRTASLLLRGAFTLVFTRVQPQILYNFWCKT